MNSLNKHVPTIVFIIGLSLLIFSIRTFFNPSTLPHMTPIVNRSLPENAPATAPTTPEALKPKKPAAIVFRPNVKPPPSVGRLDPREELIRAMKKVAEDYFGQFKLRVNIPDGFAFAEESDGPVKVLIGASEPGKNDFYFFSAKGKYLPDRAVGYLREYFSDQASVSIKGKPQPFYSRNEFKDLRRINGVIGKGTEFQAYYFTNAKTNHTHMLVLTNRLYLRSQARVRALIDSISRR